MSHGVGHPGHVNRKQYWVIWLYLLLLTVVEVGLVYVPGIPKGLLVSALFVLAIAKAALVGLFFMHLKHETRVLRWSVAIPMASPVVYAAVLIAEASWRLP
jgi:cytochrome c oxidase subunit 4